MNRNEKYVLIALFALGFASLFINPVVEGSSSFPGAWAEQWQKLPGSLRNGPSLSFDGNRIHLVVRGTDDKVYHMDWDSVSGWDGSWTFTGGYTKNRPDTCSYYNDLNMFVRGDKDASKVYYKRWSANFGYDDYWLELMDADNGGAIRSAATMGTVFSVIEANDGYAYYNMITPDIRAMQIVSQTNYIQYGKYRIHADLGLQDDWARIVIIDTSSLWLDESKMIIYEGQIGEFEDEGLEVYLVDVDADSDGKVTSARIIVSPKVYVGTATSTNMIYMGAYSFYSDLGSNGAWARVIVKDHQGSIVETHTVSQGGIVQSQVSGQTIYVDAVRALMDGTVVGTDLAITPTRHHGVSGWQRLGQSKSAPDVTVSDDGRIYIAILDNQGAVWLSTWSQTTGMEPMGYNVETYDGTLVGPITLEALGDTLFLSVKDSQDRVWFSELKDNKVKTSLIADYCFEGPTMIVAGGRVHLFVRDRELQVFHKSYVPGGAWDSEWHNLGKTTWNVVGAVGTDKYASTKAHVVIRGADEKPYYTYWNPLASSTTTTSTSTTTSTTQITTTCSEYIEAQCGYSYCQANERYYKRTCYQSDGYTYQEGKCLADPTCTTTTTVAPIIKCSPCFGTSDFVYIDHSQTQLVLKAGPRGIDILPIGSVNGSTMGTANTSMTSIVDISSCNWLDNQCNVVITYEVVSSGIRHSSMATLHLDGAVSRCDDSDGGINIYKKGTTTDDDGRKYVDSCNYCTGACEAGQTDCVTCGAVVEYSCSSGQIVKGTHLCPTGYTCEDGACIRKTTQACDWGIRVTMASPINGIIKSGDTIWVGYKPIVPKTYLPGQRIYLPASRGILTLGNDVITYSGTLENDVIAWRGNEYEYHEEVVLYAKFYRDNDDVGYVRTLKFDSDTKSVDVEGFSKMELSAGGLEYKFVFDEDIEFGGTMSNPDYVYPINIDLLGTEYSIVGTGLNQIKVIYGCIGTAKANTPVDHGSYRIYSDLGALDSWARVIIKDRGGATVDTLTISKGNSKDSSRTGLTVMVTAVRALQDGTMVGADLVVGETRSGIIKTFDVMSDVTSTTNNDCYQTETCPKWLPGTTVITTPPRPYCKDYIRMSMSSNEVPPGTPVTFSVTGIDTCDSNDLKIASRSCDNPDLCEGGMRCFTTKGGGCGVTSSGEVDCTEESTTTCYCNIEAPEETGSHLYYACLDMNKDGDYYDTYERYGRVLRVNTMDRYDIELYEGWNMISFPVDLNQQLRSVNPSNCKTVGSAWHYENGQMVKTTQAKNGESYWLKFNMNYGTSCTWTIYGERLTLEDFPRLETGWNQIGGPSESVVFDDVSGDCDVIAGPYRWNAAGPKMYELSETLEPGQGYWVAVLSPCRLGIEQPPSPPEEI